MTLSKGFYLGQYEVTQGEWEKIMGTTIEQQRDKANPRYGLFGTGDTHPMYYVSWEEAMDCGRRLTAQERESGRLPAGWEYTLPTKARWEYACRAGTTTATAFGDTLNSTQANFDSNYPYPLTDNAKGEFKQQTVAVGSYRANAWKLYDLTGNIRERCRDWYVDQLPGGTDPEVAEKALSRVDRGGGWSDYGQNCRSANRVGYRPDRRIRTVGFRLALVQVGAL